MKTYKSKQGLELSLPLSVLLGIIGALAFVNKLWLTLAIVLIVIGFITYVFMTTYYQINGNFLKVKCGFLIDKDIDIRTITKIKETYNPLSAPAVSLDRLEIKFNNKDSVLVSPEDKEGFINELKALQPAIIVQYRKSRNEVNK